MYWACSRQRAALRNLIRLCLANRSSSPLEYTLSERPSSMVIAVPLNSALRSDLLWSVLLHHYLVWPRDSPE